MYDMYIHFIFAHDKYIYFMYIHDMYMHFMYTIHKFCMYAQFACYACICHEYR